MTDPIEASPKPMGRRERKKLATKARILDAALSLMADKGYDGVTVGEICEKADIANATFFGYFPTKAGLIVSFNEKMTARIEVKLTEYDIPTTEKLELLRALLIDEWRAQADILQGLIGDIASGKSPSVPFMEANRSLIALVVQIVTAGQKAGEFVRHIPAETIALTLVSAWTTIAFRLASGGGPDESLLAHRHMLDIVLKGITP